MLVSLFLELQQLFVKRICFCTSFLGNSNVVMPTVHEANRFYVSKGSMGFRKHYVGTGLQLTADSGSAAPRTIFFVKRIA